MRKILLTQDKATMVDDETFEFLSKWLWHLDKGYVTRSVTLSDKTRRVLPMHRLLMGLQFGDKRTVDHIDGNPLNNQIVNLRICTQSNNTKNRRKQKNPASSKYKGVFYCKRTKKWKSKVKHNGVDIFLGCFDSEIEAAEAYNETAPKYHGEFARLNEVDYG
jgi:hypothetical protein